MSPIPKANEPGNNPGPSGDGGELDPQPQSFNTVLNAGTVSSEDEGSDGGEDDNQYGGYQLLVQDPEAEAEAEPDNSESGDEMGGDAADVDLENEEEFVFHRWTGSDQSPTDSSQVSSGEGGGGGDPAHPNLPPHLAKLLPTTAPTPDSATTRITHTDTPTSLEHRKNKMATDDQIRAAMAGLSLPSMAIPPWAQSVSEQDWKEQLVARIQNNSDDQQKDGIEATMTNQPHAEDGGNG